MRASKVFRTTLFLACLALAGQALGAQAGFRHGVLMRGQVLEVDAKSLVVCVGAEDGAKVGQVLDVIRHVRASGSPKQAGHRYRREPVGTVRIATLFDGHYATAVVVSGAPQVHDTVELARK